MQRHFKSDESAAPTLGLRVRRITIPSGDIAFVDEGDGPPVLLLHGAPITALGLVRVIRGLRDQHRVLAPDLPGFGQSHPSATFAGSLREYATSVVEFCDAVGLARFVLFGCDAGACIGLAAAANMSSSIAGLVVADTVPFPLNGRAWFVKMILKHVVTSAPARWLNRRLNLLPWLVATVDPLRRPFSAHERRVLIGQYDSYDDRDRILDVFSAMARDDEFMRDTAEAIAARLADTPTLLLFGQFDPVRLAGGISRFQQMFRHSTLALVRREKHFPILAAGAEVATAMKAWMRVTTMRDEAQQPSGAQTTLRSRPAPGFNRA